MPLLAAFLIGLVFGAVAARTHFCTMGALSDIYLFGSRRRLRGLVMAAAVALAGTSLLALARGPVSGAPPDLPWLPVVAGSFAFGVGMTLAGGCITRNLTRAGQGSLRAAATLLVAALAAAALGMDVLAGPAGLLARLHLAAPPLPGGVQPFVGLVLAALAAAWCVRPAKERRRAHADLLAGASLGLLVPLWRLLVMPETLPPLSPAFLLPMVDVLHVLAGAGPLQPGMALVAGVLAGAAATGLHGGTSRFESFVDRADLRRHLIGALLMGLGGGLAGTCSFGLIVSGIGALLPGAFLGTMALALGCRQTLRVMEGRSFFGR